MTRASMSTAHPMDELQYELVNERLSYSNEETHRDVEIADTVSSVQIPASKSPSGASIGFHDDEDESISTRASSTSFKAAQVPDDVLDSVPSSGDENEPPFQETNLVETMHGNNSDDEVADDDDSVEFVALWQSTIQSESVSSRFQDQQQHQRLAASQPTDAFSEPNTTSPEVKNNSDSSRESHRERQTNNKVEVRSLNNGPFNIFYNFIIKVLNAVVILVYVCLVVAFVCFVICTITFCIHGRFSLFWKSPTEGVQSEPPAKLGIAMKKQDYVKLTPLTHARDLKLEVTTDGTKLVKSNFMAEKLGAPSLLCDDEIATQPAVVAVDGQDRPLLTQEGNKQEELPYNSSISGIAFQDGTETLIDEVVTKPTEAPVVKYLTENSKIFATGLGSTAVDLVPYLALASMGIGHYVLAAITALLCFIIIPFLKQLNGTAKRHEHSLAGNMQCQSSDVDDLCHFLRLCDNGLSRTGRVPRASPSKSPLFGYNVATYQTLTKEELHNIGRYLRVPLLHSMDNKATLIQKIVPVYEAKLQGMLVQGIKQVLITKKISAAAWEKKTDLVRLAVEAGF